MQNAAHVACMLHAQSRRTELLPAYVMLEMDVWGVHIRITCAYVLLCSIYIVCTSLAC